MTTSPAATLCKRFAALLTGAAMIIAGLVCGRLHPRGVSLPTSDARFIGMSACAECHESITQEFLESPHRLTLARLRDTPLAGRLAGRRITDPTRDAYLEFQETDSSFSIRSERYAPGKPVEFQWCFGSGQHGQTPLAIVQGPDRNTWLLQCRFSWFARTDKLELTPGELPDAHSKGIEWLGRVSDEGQVRRCFGCHSTSWSERDGSIDFATLVPGVQCEKCHGPRASHVAGFRSGNSSEPVPALSQRSALESIHWCGVCHRQDELVGPNDLNANNVQLARFAPIGLIQSACFRLSSADAQPTCLTCHDPHKPASRDPNWYSEQCRKCHGAATVPGSVACRARPTDRDCVSCHMPKVGVGPALFTDHWIRVRAAE